MWWASPTKEKRRQKEKGNDFPAFFWKKESGAKKTSFQWPQAIGPARYKKTS